ncbi:hypothetical protein ABEB36_009544 [Hypothenemus hampei]|uniref:Uncharacterized protein n=1 Tax=Hypothenemus hampei TaxID=57062 RepID=A0ABD1EGS6_HYPHA
MAFELILLGALIFIFIVSFCGLLQKIKQTYDRERLIAERVVRRREQQERIRRPDDSFTEIYLNPAFGSSSLEEGIFPAAPPPYSRYQSEAPPKYDDVVKLHEPRNNNNDNNNTNNTSFTNEEPADAQHDTALPPYTINVTLLAEATTRQ